MNERAIQPFTTLSRCDGQHEVICSNTGRPVAVRSSRRSASGLAYKLNGAAMRGPKALAAALGCRERRT